MKKIILISGILLLAINLVMILTISCHSGDLSGQPGNQSIAADNYLKYCAGCHGSKLEKFAEKAWMDEEGTSSAFSSIKFGIETIGMPAFQKTFSDPEIEALAAYVKKGIPEDRTF